MKKDPGIFMNILLKNKTALFLTLLGILTVIFSLLSDIFGTGRGGIGYAQLLTIDAGATCAIIGIGLMLAGHKKEYIQPSLLDRIPDLPNILWVVAGFFIGYMIFLIFPVFFNPIQRIVYLHRYLPDSSPIGMDFRATLEAVQSWFTRGVAPIYYPPFVTLTFAPLLLLDFPTNYYIFTAISIVGFFLFAFLVPFLIAGTQERPIVLFIFGISIFSYGLQFELERGQFHTLAMLLCISAVYLFHRHPRYRFFAYTLFCMSIQIKIYPALFFVMFVDDWRDWMTNIKRFAALGLANFLLLFLLGYSYFSKFLAHIVASVVNSPGAWSGNHSITGFLNYISSLDTLLGHPNWPARVNENAALLSNLLLAYFAVCFLIVLANAFRRNTPGIDPFLMMACVLGGLIIPSINHDYTLPLLTAPFALSVSERYTRKVNGRIIVILLLVISSFTYTTTLLPFIHKPVILKNSFPLLIILLTTTTLLSLLREKENTPSMYTADRKEES